MSDKPVNILARENYQDRNTIYGVYRFYGNGCFSYFSLNRNEPTLTKEMFDPNFTGWRGVLYNKKGKIKGDMVTQVSGMGTIGKVTKTFEFRGDSLFVHVKDRRWDQIYIKRKIASVLLNFKAEW